VTTAAQPNITSVGTLSSLDVTGNIAGGNLITAGLVSLSSIVKTGSNAVGNIGSASNYFNRVFATATTALYADIAEIYSADADYAPGTVVIFGGEQEITVTTEAADERVAGVISTKPAYQMNSGLEGEHVAIVALTGRVPCRVVGNIKKGDRLVTSSIPGVATTLQMDSYLPGCIIGKALEEYNSTDIGVITIVVGRV
jgi:hypothetical protein